MKQKTPKVKKLAVDGQNVFVHEGKVYHGEYDPKYAVGDYTLIGTVKDIITVVEKADAYFKQVDVKLPQLYGETVVLDVEAKTINVGCECFKIEYAKTFAAALKKTVTK